MKGSACEPLVVENSAELDRIFRTGNAMQPDSHSVRPGSARRGSSDSDSSDSSSRPKLSDALRRVSFPPQRPRRAQQLTSRGGPSRRTVQSPLAEKAPSRRNPCSPSCASRSAVRLNPPIKSSITSRSSKVESGLMKGREDVRGSDRTRSSSMGQNASQRHPFCDIINKPTQLNVPDEDQRQTSNGRRASNKATGRKPFVQLPDVTGLTSAVASPAKPALKNYVYRGGEGLRKNESEL